MASNGYPLCCFKNKKRGALLVRERPRIYSVVISQSELRLLGLRSDLGSLVVGAVVDLLRDDDRVQGLAGRMSTLAEVRADFFSGNLGDLGSDGASSKIILHFENPP